VKPKGTLSAPTVLLSVFQIESTSPSTEKNALTIQLLDWGNDTATWERQLSGKHFWLKQVSLRNYEFCIVFIE